MAIGFLEADAGLQSDEFGFERFDADLSKQRGLGAHDNAFGEDEAQVVDGEADDVAGFDHGFGTELPVVGDGAWGDAVYLSGHFDGLGIAAIALAADGDGHGVAELMGFDLGDGFGVGDMAEDEPFEFVAQINEGLEEAGGIAVSAPADDVGGVNDDDGTAFGGGGLADGILWREHGLGQEATAGVPCLLADGSDELLGEVGVVVGDGPDGPALIGDVLPGVAGAKRAIDHVVDLVGIDHGVEYLLERTGVGAIIRGREQEGDALAGGGWIDLVVEDIEKDVGGAPAGFDLVDVGMGPVGSHCGGQVEHLVGDDGVTIECARDGDVRADFIANDAEDVAIEIGKGDAADCAVKREADSIQGRGALELATQC